MNLVKDKKGPCWILSHKRCGVTESLFLTFDEMCSLYKIMVEWLWPERLEEEDDEDEEEDRGEETERDTLLQGV